MDLIGQRGCKEMNVNLNANANVNPSRLLSEGRSEQKLNASRELGADHTYRAGDESLAAEVRRLDSDGLDVVFDCVGSEE